MVGRIILAIVLGLGALFVADEASARCRGCGLFGGRAPVRSFFRNRQPVRRIARGVARVVVAPSRVIVQRRQAIRSYRASNRTVAVASVPNQVVSQLGPVNEQIVSSEPEVITDYPVYTEAYSYPRMSTCGPNGCN